MDAYTHHSMLVSEIIDGQAPVFEKSSIDEFYLDLTGTDTLYHQRPIVDVAREIRETVFAETSINISIGGGTNRLIAKLAVRKAKPANVFIVEPGAEAEFMREIPLAAIPGIGPRFQERLRAYGLKSAADVLPLERKLLVMWFGEGTADWLYDRVRGIGPASVEPHGEQKSISRDETFARDIGDDEALATELLHLVVRAGRDLRGDSLRARTVSVRIRDADFTDRRASRTLNSAIESDRAIYQTALKLLTRLRAQRRTSARLLSVSLSNFSATDGPAQLALFADTGDNLETERDRRVARVMDDVRGRFGSKAIVPGRILPSS